MSDDPKIYAVSQEGALRQGELLSGLNEFQPTSDEADRQRQVKLDCVVHPYAMVLSQTCDLEQDFLVREKQRVDEPVSGQAKLLPCILFCDVFRASELRDQEDIKSDIWKRVKANKDERYQFLSAVPASEDSMGEGLEELGLDFKRYFALPTAEVYLQLRLQGGTARRCHLLNPYLEHLSTRFSYYQFRVALPKDHS
ncbi:MAG: hypothetical protein ACRD2P_07930 [Terriglobia bacterium]